MATPASTQRTERKRRRASFASLCLAALLSLAAQVSSAADRMHQTLGGDSQRAPTILVFGDSLSAAYGIDSEQGWVSLLQRQLRDDGFAHRVINASISGETTAGGLRRLPDALEKWQPTLLILELGANDGLRGKPLKTIRDNLAQIIRTAHNANCRVLLLGMHIPPNYGPRYSDGFHALFEQLASEYSVALLPFLLADVATRSDWMQRDGLHPTADAQPTLLAHVWGVLEPLLAGRH